MLLFLFLLPDGVLCCCYRISLILLESVAFLGRWLRNFNSIYHMLLHHNADTCYLSLHPTSLCTHRATVYSCMHMYGRGPGYLRTMHTAIRGRSAYTHYILCCLFSPFVLFSLSFIISSLGTTTAVHPLDTANNNIKTLSSSLFFLPYQSKHTAVPAVRLCTRTHISFENRLAAKSTEASGQKSQQQVSGGKACT